MAAKPSIQIRQLSPTTPRETLERAARVFEDSFRGSELSAIMKGDDPDLSFARAMALVITTSLDLACYVAEVDGEMVGVLLAKPPGFVLRKSPNMHGPHSDLVDQLAKPYPDIVNGTHEHFEHVGELKRRAYGAEDVTNTWFISHICVLKAWQGKGIGAALMRHLKERSNEDKCTLFAISEPLVGFYERFGFKTLADAQWRINDSHDVHFWAMATD